jgi:imidazolonepropionase-like amidohydrolase
MNRLLLLLFALISGCAASPSGSGLHDRYAITHVNVVDVENGRVLAAQTVLIEGNQITAVGPADEVRAPEGARVIDARGKYLIPGLWDMHSHVLFEGMDRYMALLVASGVTGIREMGNSPMPLFRIREVRREILAGDRLGPRFISSGVLVDGPHSRWKDGVALADTPERGRALVDSLANAGADFIKVYNYLRPDVYHAIVESAAARQVPVAGHVPSLVTALEASEANQRSFEHLVGVDQGCSAEEGALIATSREELDAIARGDDVAAAELERQWWDRLLATHDPVRCSALLHQLAHNRTWQTPTLVNIHTRCVESTTLTVDGRLVYVPEFVQAWWAAAVAQGTDHNSEKDQARCRLRMALVGEMNRAGVPLLAGTDAANPFVIWGFSLHDELALLVAAGLSPLEALQSATLNPARFLDATDSLGTIEPGKLADLVLLDANPLENIHSTRKIAAVVLNGRYMNRMTLDSLFAEAENGIR